MTPLAARHVIFPVVLPRRRAHLAVFADLVVADSDSLNGDVVDCEEAEADGDLELELELHWVGMGSKSNRLGRTPLL
jgi:hypothetical protein